MERAFVQFTCPDCVHEWEVTADGETPSPRETLTCPNCDSVAPVAEFARTKRDYETLRSFAE